MTVRSFHGKDFEIRFVQFVLENSPILEEITIECMKNPDFNQDEVKAVLMPFCMGSTELNLVGGTYDPGSDDSSDSDNSSNGSYSSDSD